MIPRLAVEAREQLDAYAAELRRWGARMNLVGSTSAQAIDVHFTDSLAAAPLVESGRRVVDLGSGAGFPGIPLQIARPDLEITLVEARERRVHFLRHVIRTLSLACEVRRARIEEGPGPGQPFDLALLRAVAPPETSLALAIPWVHGAGEVWIWAREAPAPVVERALSAIPLGERGQILRIHAAAVPCGTPRWP